MIITLRTSEPHLAALSLTGWTRRADDPGPVKRGVVVLKGSYTLVGVSGGPLDPEPTTVPPRIVMADEGRPLPDGADQPEDYDLVYEADTALEKARADVVVRGWVEHATGGLAVPDPPEVAATVSIAGDEWAGRTVGLPGPDPDAGRNLFGWLSKTRTPRRINAPRRDPLPASYHAGFNNFSRRGVGFTAPTRNSLPEGAEVRVRKHTTEGTTADFAFHLPTSLGYTARLRAYCGHGVDRARRWRVVEEVPMVPDTLIVDPSERAATVLWRAGWRHDLAPEEHWRMVEVLPAGGR